MENVYADSTYAQGYAGLDWVGTYSLVARDLPSILEAHCQGRRALDFGCGAGRSTRLLRTLGFDAVGIDVAASMVEQARKLDPDHDYRVIEDGDFSELPAHSFDLIFACFPFDNIPGAGKKAELLSGLRGLLAPGGVLVNVVSAAEIYVHEWVTFTTACFPENRTAKDGEVVKIITRDFEGQPVCDDELCSDSMYLDIYQRAGLEPVQHYRTLGTDADGIDWLSESEISPWVIWVLKAAESA